MVLSKLLIKNEEVMSEAHDGVKKKKFSKHPAAKARRRTALELLEGRLKNPDNYNDKQLSKMKKEVETLKERI